MRYWYSILVLLVSTWSGLAVQAQPSTQYMYWHQMDLGFWYTETNTGLDSLVPPYATTKPLAQHGLVSPVPAAGLFQLHGSARRFMAWVGLVKHAKASATITILGSGTGTTQLLQQVLEPGAAPLLIDLDLSGLTLLDVQVTSMAEQDTLPCLYWLDARFVLPKDAGPPKLMPYLSTAPLVQPTADVPAPVLTVPEVWAAYPGRWFAQKVHLSGAEPLRLEAKDLPKGLMLDADKRLVYGSLPAGTYAFTLLVSNARGKDKKRIKLVVRTDLQGFLPPPRGFVVSHGRDYDQLKLESLTKSMLQKGWLAAGWESVVLADGWQGNRDTRLHALQPLKHKFPLLEDWLARTHKQGFKRYLYMAEGRKSPGGFPGTHADAWTGKLLPDPGEDAGKMSFVAEDALQFSQWKADGVYLHCSSAGIQAEWLQYMAKYMPGGTLIPEHTATGVPDPNPTVGALVAEPVLAAPSQKPYTWFTLLAELQHILKEGTGAHKAHKLAIHRPATDFWIWPEQVHRVQLGLYAILGKPLWLQENPAGLSPLAQTSLLNPEVLAVQHAIGSKPEVYMAATGHVVYVRKTLPTGAYYLAAINTAPAPEPLVWQGALPSKVRDLWGRKNLTAAGASGLIVPSRGMVLLYCRP